MKSPSFQARCARTFEPAHLPRRSLIALAVSGLFAFSATPAMAATIFVDGVNCTLSGAITNANGTTSYAGGCLNGGPGLDTLNLLNDITLTAPLPTIDSDITIEGNGHTIRRDPTAPGFGIFAVDLGAHFTLNQTTVSGGNNDSGNGGAVLLRSRTTLTLSNSTLSGNSASNAGGGIYNSGTVRVLNNSSVSGNTAGSTGGGIFNNGALGGGVEINDSSVSNNVTTRGIAGGFYNGPGGTTTIRNSLISGNRALGGNTGFAGGLFNSGVLLLEGSTVSGNSASENGGGVISASADSMLSITSSTLSGNMATRAGGGLSLGTSATATVTNSTLSGNTAGQRGGGLMAFGSSNLSVNDSTLTGNSAGTLGGGGLHAYGDAAVTLTRSLIAGNTDTGAADEIFRSASPGGSFAIDARDLFGHSGIDSAAAFENFTPGVNDLNATMGGANATALAAIVNPTLANNGGPTLTHALVAGSPAIDKIALGFCSATDQRGVARPQGAACDIGAFELAPLPVLVTSRLTAALSAQSTNPTPVAEGAAGVFSFTSRFCNSSAQAISGAFSRTRELSPGKSLISRTRNAAAAPLGEVGSEQDFPLAMGNADGLLGNGECVNVLYRIGLNTRTPFSFRVDLLGNVVP